MDCRRRIALLLPALLAIFPASGCSSVGGLFGLTPPAHKLIPAAEQLRAAAVAPAPLPRELNKALLPAYIVEPGDTLLVIPARLDSPIRLPGDQTVMQDGTIDLGEFGRPVVAGKTLPAIQSEITKLIEAKEKGAAATAIDVRLVGRVSKVYYVLGEVNAPGAFPIQGRETVLDGIIAAGGITRRASTKKIILSRPTQPDGCRVVLPICYDNIVQLGDTSTNYQLLPGDRIYVASKGMFDDLCPRKNKDCSICGGPQFPCPLGGGACGDAATGAAPILPMVGAPGLPAMGTLPPTP